jgi:hypothetical protein
MLNLGSVERSIRWLTSEKDWDSQMRERSLPPDISPAKTTKRLGYKVNRCKSHASNQKIRESSMPFEAKAYPLDRLMTELIRWLRLITKISYYHINSRCNDLDTKCTGTITST